VLLAVAWLVPEWIGAGNPLDAGEQARSEPPWSLSHAFSPWKRAVLRVHNHTGLLIEVLAAVAVARALAHRSWVLLAIAAAAGAEAAMFVAMTEVGFSGNPRYVLPALTLLCVLAGAGLGALLEVRRAGLAVGAAAAAALAVLAAPETAARVDRLVVEAGEVGRRMEVHRDLARAVTRAGGPAAVNRFGPATVNRALQTRMAWELGRPLYEIEAASGEGVVFSSYREFLAGRRPLSRPVHAIPLGRVGSWHVYRRRAVLQRFCRHFTSRRRRAGVGEFG
jgi:hypothetical protein